MFSVIIASRAEGALLWATLASIRGDLEASGHDFEILVAANEENNVFGPMIHELVGSPICKVLLTGADSPQAARNLAARKAVGDVLFFVDAHTIFVPGFAARLSHEMKRTGAQAAFGGTRYTSASPTFGMRVDWNGHLWGADQLWHHPDGPEHKEPFPILMAGHGAFCVEREAFEAIGGYWEALKGWGGEETQFNLKMWLLGYRMVMCPSVYHWHYLPPGLRRGQEIFSDRAFVRNFLLVAAAYGGEKQVRKAYESFVVAHWGFRRLHTDLPYEVMTDPEVVKERRFIEERGVYKNIDQLRESLEAEVVC